MVGFDEMNAAGKHVVDGLSFTVVLGTLLSVLPHVSALLSIVWLLLRIYETRTIQKLLGRTVQPENRDDV